MKKITFLALLTVATSLFTTSVNAQTDYTFSLVNNGNYSFSIVCIPTTTTSNFQTNIQSHGYTVFIPNLPGVALTIDSSLGGTHGDNGFTGDQVNGSASERGYLLTEPALPAPIDIAAPSAMEQTVLMTFSISGMPTTGELRLMSKTDPEATAFGGALIPYMQADTTDDGSFNYANRINSPTGISQTTTIPFNTLGTASNEFLNVSVFPNPVKDVLNIKGLEQDLNKVEVYSITGQKILSQASNLKSINVSHFQSGVYFVKLYTKTASTTLKITKS